MEAVYYFDEELGGCPVKEYLSRFAINKNDSLKEKNKKEKLITEIRSKVSHVLGNDGKPDGCIAKTTKGYGFCRIRLNKDTNTKIRIPYFCRDNKLILLHAFEKPAIYKKNSREARTVEKNRMMAGEYRKKFILNPKLYEK